VSMVRRSTRDVVQKAAGMMSQSGCRRSAHHFITKSKNHGRLDVTLLHLSSDRTRMSLWVNASRAFSAVLCAVIISTSLCAADTTVSVLFSGQIRCVHVLFCDVICQSASFTSSQAFRNMFSKFKCPVEPQCPSIQAASLAYSTPVAI
jgi:hypothetical protein